MIRDVLLISEATIKENSVINDNYWGKFLFPSIQYAQENGLQSILGECLYQRICYLVQQRLIVEIEYADYKNLLDNYIQPYLLNQVISDSLVDVSVKIANIGTVMNNDEHVANIPQKEYELLRNKYVGKADFYAKKLQDYLKENEDLFPEIANCGCNGGGNLDSITNASQGIWLGGSRGYKR